jgi:hypothetical protein
MWAQFTPAADAGGWLEFHSTLDINTSIAMAGLFGPALGAVVVTAKGDCVCRRTSRPQESRVANSQRQGERAHTSP